MLHLCPSQPAAPCRVKWTVPVSGESRALRSARLSSAQLGCQRYKLTMWLLSERDSSTQEVCTDGYYMSPGTASHGGRDEGAKERKKTGWGKDTGAEEEDRWRGRGDRGRQAGGLRLIKGEEKSQAEQGESDVYTYLRRQRQGKTHGEWYKEGEAEE